MSALRLEALRTRLLAPVDLDIAAGSLTFVSGPSGAGKSLLLRAIADLDPNDGEVYVGQLARSALAAPDWRRRVGLLPAESGWWAETVAEHFPGADDGAARGMGKSAETKPTASVQSGANPAESEQHESDLMALLHQLSFGHDVLGWSVNRLSTGERQRLALVRLLANRPEALLLDEATANLDPTNRDRVEAVIDAYRLRHGAAVLWVSHDAEQRARLGDASLVIRDGALVSEQAA
jgi:ABC-type iron transport system FetAB ATPase subunit